MADIKWETYALDVCQLITDASMFWTNEDEERIPLLKIAKERAEIAIRKHREEYMKRMED